MCFGGGEAREKAFGVVEQGVGRLRGLLKWEAAEPKVYTSYSHLVRYIKRLDCLRQGGAFKKGLLPVSRTFHEGGL